jgi:hypothetical protein
VQDYDDDNHNYFYNLFANNLDNDEDNNAGELDDINEDYNYDK